MSTQTWKGVAIAVQSALATALTVTAITKASPGVVSYTGTDPSNGDYVVLAINGMVELNNRVVRVANVNGAGNTFELEGVDTSLFNTFSSGTAQVITFGTSLATIRSVNVSGGEFPLIDDTTVHDLQEVVIPGLPTAMVYDLGSRWDPSDAGLVALKNASDNQAQRAFKFTFQNGYKWLFYGYVGCSMALGGQTKEIVTTPVKVTALGKGTAYSS